MCSGPHRFATHFGLWLGGERARSGAIRWITDTVPERGVLRLRGNRQWRVILRILWRFGGIRRPLRGDTASA